MADSFVQLEDDSLAAGKKVRTQTRVVGADTVHEHYFITIDESGNKAVVISSTSTLSNVAASASNVTVLASNTARRGAHFYNDSTSACYLKYGATASATSFTVKIFGNGYHELPQPNYSGIIDCIWDSASGSMRITELT